MIVSDTESRTKVEVVKDFYYEYKDSLNNDAKLNVIGLVGDFEFGSGFAGQQSYLSVTFVAPEAYLESINRRHAVRITVHGIPEVCCKYL